VVGMSQMLCISIIIPHSALVLFYPAARSVAVL